MNTQIRNGANMTGRVVTTTVKRLFWFTVIVALLFVALVSGTFLGALQILTK